ncbi:hypothetical protein EJ05DRAFT_540960 [Pseudovirgaria hyperparasitica]|uniref:Uncharacterized protein n=1 Tax=Pseudovirgaria hyperparasitica TaxID=470096 RepID=A0A6A6VXH1_9PEZI|nr:uncharacterized protein EJ05DRAFT_540960 [Pseudovirgaria hyperparasitica]KAF2754923.1 hypothetical protein EJ05DRAFT_540960 [Pseudovirgaria hyperparasitica]
MDACNAKSAESSVMSKSPVVTDTTPIVHCCTMIQGRVVMEAARDADLKSAFYQVSQDLQLHPVKHVATLVQSTSRLHVFQVALPQLAFSHEYLMHGILALSALHLAYRCPGRRNEYTLMATYHEQIALGEFRAALSQVTQDNCHALLALGALLAIMPFASTASQRSLIPIIPSMDEIAQSFHLIQGIKNILQSPSAIGIVQNGPLGPLLRCGSPVAPGTLGGAFAESLDKLEHLNNGGIVCKSMPADHIACKGAIAGLRQTYALIRAEDVVREFAVWTWPSLVPARFLDLIRQRHPMALVILAHFGVLSNLFVNSWFLRGWGACVLQGVVGELDAAGLGMRRWVDEPIRWLRQGVSL